MFSQRKRKEGERGGGGLLHTCTYVCMYIFSVGGAAPPTGTHLNQQSEEELGNAEVEWAQVEVVPQSMQLRGT